MNSPAGSGSVVVTGLRPYPGETLALCAFKVTVMAVPSTPSSTEDLLHLAATELPLVFWQTDTELRFTASFGAGLTHLRLKPGDVVGMSLLDFFQIEDPDFPLIKIHRDALEGRGSCLDDRWAGRDYHVRVAPLRDDGGEIVGTLGVAQDVTDSKQSQAALRESENRFRAIIEQSGDITLVVDPQGGVKYVSPAMQRVAGYAPDDVVGKYPVDFFHPEDVETGLEILQAATKMPGRTIQLPYFRVRYRDGQYHQFEASVTALLDVAGVEGILIQCRDVGERIEAEEELRRSQARWQSLVESAPNIVMNVDLDRKITFINRAEAPLTIEQVIGTSYFDYVHPDYMQTAQACLDLVLRTGQAAGYEIKGPEILPDTWWIVRVGPIKEYDEVVGLTVVLTDVTELKRSERALAESNEKYRLLVDNQTDLVTKFDLDRNVLYVSPSCCRTTGLTEAELLTTDFLSLVHEDDRRRVLDAVERVNRPPYVAHVEDRMWTQRGWRWFSWINSAVRNDEGEVVAVVGVGRDVTERREAEEAMRASEARFRAVFDHAATGIALANLDGRLIQWNSAFRRMLGYSDQEMAGISFRDFTFPEDVLGEVGGIQEVQAGRRDVYRTEKRYRRKDGSIVWGDLSCTVVRDDQGQPRFAIGMVEDITERKHAEAELHAAHEQLRAARDKAEFRVRQRTADLAAANTQLAAEIEERRQAESALEESERRFRLAFEESPWGMTIIGPDGTWLQVNQAFCRMLGYDARDLVGMYAAQVTHPDDLQWNSELARQLVEGQIPSFRFEKRYIRRDGGLVWAAINATVVRDESGEILYGLTMVEDVTQRKQAQQALRRAERLSSIGTLAAGIAHEVNNPLGAIQLDAETALYCIGQPGKQETVAACLQNIAASAQRGGQIVKDVLRFARTDRRPKSTDDLRGAAERACRLTRRPAEKSGVVIQYLPPDEELPVRFNSTQIEQVIVNLITNSVQASPPGGRVQITLDRDGKSARVIVRDFGRGMSPDEADRIFDPFYTTREGEGGTGLGLSISYGIVREHEGTINVETCPNAGTTMIVRLPLVSDEK